MFVRIVTSKGESLDECTRYRIRKDTNPEKFFLTLENDNTSKDPITYEIDKTQPNTGVYVMNNLGRTIDTIFVMHE